MPPYLAGRTKETEEFVRLLKQDVVLSNFVLTGLRGAGKTVLLETLKPLAQQRGWVWVGTDLTESAAMSEENLAVRLITDLSVHTSELVWFEQKGATPIGFSAEPGVDQFKLTHRNLMDLYSSTPGLVIDKLKRVFEVVSAALKFTPHRGIIFAYDEAQTLGVRSTKEVSALTLLLDLFQSTQKQGVLFMLALAGLPTLFPKMVEARTFAERMCRVVFLDRLNDPESRQAIVRPIEAADCPVKLSEDSVGRIVKLSAGYPYFIQFICREAFDAFVQGNQSVPEEEIIRKLDSDFFAGRWSRSTDRQRQLLYVAARLDSCDSEFSVQDLVDQSKELLAKPFGSSHVNQMLATLSDAGLIYKNRHGKYSFAVPLLWNFIQRNRDTIEGLEAEPSEEQLPLIS